MNKLRDLIFIAIPYLTFCAFMYQGIFWSIIGFNGLNFLNSISIITSAFDLQSITYIIVFLFSGLISASGKLIKVQKNAKEKYGDTVLKAFVAILVIAVLVFAWVYHNGFLYLIILTVLTVSFTQFDFLFIDEITENFIFRELLKAIIIYIPFSFILSAIRHADNIKSNTNYLYTLRVNNQNIDTLKYLSNNGKTYLFSDLKNTKTLILDSDSITLYSKRSHSSY